ncbi:MAG: TMEM175 family protein [Thermoplasmata archaeon]|nr:TMEM175 family protein [Thermoplasmata archaeon]
METLSDLVFGLALSVGALALVGHPPTTATGLYSSIAQFGFSFLILIVTWLAYTRLMALEPSESPRAVALNAALLFSVSLEPFLFNLLVSSSLHSSFEGTVSQVYAVDLGVMIGVLGWLTWELATERRPPLAGKVRDGLRRESLYRWIISGVYFLSAAPVFGDVVLLGQPLRPVIWTAAIVLFYVLRRNTVPVGEL